MQGPADETVGSSFNADLLQSARDRTLEVILETAARMKPGTTEAQARELLQSIQAAKGAPKSWHPPQIRFGENTPLPFGKKCAENVALAESDIFFFDIGPIFDGHEGDVGRPFALGDDPEMSRCCRDAGAIWALVSERWRATGATGATGAELYRFASACAEARGWQLLLEKANGHRIADFPHAARSRGSVEGWEKTPAPLRWILEIQIRHPTRPFGAFYEDLLG